MKKINAVRILSHIGPTRLETDLLELVHFSFSKHAFIRFALWSAQFFSVLCFHFLGGRF